MSPGTLALMCDEQDTMFTASQNAVPQQTVTVNQNQSALYAEQEKVVLTEFRDCLRKLVTCGRMKGTPNVPTMLIANTKSLHVTSSCYLKVSDICQYCLIWFHQTEWVYMVLCCPT